MSRSEMKPILLKATSQFSKPFDVTIVCLLTTNVLTFIICSSIIWYQQNELMKVKEQNQIAYHVRVSRSVGGQGEQNNFHPFFAPLYAGISDDMMKAMCANKRNQISSQDVVVMTLNQGKQGPEYRREENTKKESIKKESDQQQVISKKKRKCNRVIGLGQKVLHDERRMKQGGIIKSGNSWFITEYDRGYAIFEILDNPGKIDFSDPQTIHTLSFPFTGYNHAYSHANNTIYYISEDGSFISSYNTKTQKGMGHRKINSLINRNIYYQIEGSSALHYSENDLWLIYNRDEHNHLTVSHLEPKTLKEIKTIRLNKFDRPIRNTFITCGILYAIDCEGYKCRVLPIFDLIRNKYVMKKENFLLRGGNHWTSYGNITSLTYDSISRKLGVLDDGKIYSVQVNIE